ncbi:MAG: acyl-CoA thioesterase [Flavobacteriia bacterium]|nr:acyl-CoA thioesterase [Flavobacteriia bacterium]
MIKPVKIQVRFADLDLMAHVNNSVYFTYFELARVQYFQQLLGEKWDWRKYGMLLKKNEITYHKSVLLYDEPEIYIYTSYIGTKSFVFDYELMVNNELYTTGSSLMICYDAINNQTIEIPLKLKEALESIKRIEK